MLGSVPWILVNFERKTRDGQFGTYVGVDMHQSSKTDHCDVFLRDLQQHPFQHTRAVRKLLSVVFCKRKHIVEQATKLMCVCVCELRVRAVSSSARAQISSYIDYVRPPRKLRGHVALSAQARARAAVESRMGSLDCQEKQAQAGTSRQGRNQIVISPAESAVNSRIWSSIRPGMLCWIPKA